MPRDIVVHWWAHMSVCKTSVPRHIMKRHRSLSQLTASDFAFVNVAKQPNSLISSDNTRASGPSLIIGQHTWDLLDRISLCLQLPASLFLSRDDMNSADYVVASSPSVRHIPVLCPNDSNCRNSFTS